MRLQLGAVDGQAEGQLFLRAGFVIADQHRRLAARGGGLHRLAQGAGGQQKAVAEAVAAIDDQERKGFFHGRVLQPVIHDNGARPFGQRQAGTGGAVMRQHGGGGGGEQHGFIADIKCIVLAAIDEDGPGETSAIAACERVGVELQPRKDIEHHHGLTGSADPDISDAYGLDAKRHARRCTRRAVAIRVMRLNGRKICAAMPRWDQNSGAFMAFAP